MTQPFFSILIPTRDRPAWLDLVLLSFTKQKYKNFEVIVSDNYLNESCFDVCQKYREKLNLIYIHPPKSLSMAENYEYAMSHSKGGYILALEDKFALFPFALSAISDVISKESPDIINYYSDTYTPDIDNSRIGKWNPQYNIYPSLKFCSKNSLKKRLNFTTSYNDQLPMLKKRNKIVMGCWSRSLVQEIQKTQNIFQPISLDYTSMALGVIFSKKLAFDFGRSLGLYIRRDSDSNGALTAAFFEKAKKFVQDVDPDKEYAKYCPFKDMVFVQCVSIATDLLKIIEKCKQSHKFRVCLRSLAIRTYEEIDQYQDLTNAEKENYKKKIPLPNRFFIIYDKIRNFILCNYHPFFVFLYIKVNLLGRLKIKKYSDLLKHRNFCKSYLNNSESFEIILDRGDAHYSNIFN